MHKLGIPLPISQVDVLDADGRFLGRSDFWFEGTATVGEFDGEVKYGFIPDGPAGHDALIAEKRREDAIRRTGAVMARWMWRDLATGSAWGGTLLDAIEQGRRALDRGFVTAVFRPADVRAR